MLAAQCDVIEQLDAAHKTNLMHSQIILMIGRKRGSNSTTYREGISSWRKRRYYLVGTNILENSIITTEVIC